MRRLGLGMFSYFSAIMSPFSSAAAFIKITLAAFVLTTGLSASVGAASSNTADDHAAAIPQDAIRIRIIANSDSSFDQKVKADIRDRVADVIRAWGTMPAEHDEARSLIQSHLSDIQDTADHTLQKWAVAYSAKVELAPVPFPDKVFGGRTYSAGDYEALRVTLGGGQGANWWCVLFPPLCLTAATKAEAQPEARITTAAAKQDAGHKASTSVVKTSSKADTVSADTADQEKPKARFFVWEMFKGFAKFLKSLFS